MIVTIIDGTCWKCQQPMKIAFTEGKDEMTSYCGPDEFEEKEIEFSISKGAVIKPHYSKTANETYLSNTCSHCNSFAGNFYLFSQYIQPAYMGEFEYTVYEF